MTTTQARPQPAARTLLLRPGTRKAALAVHIVTAGAWIGMTAILGVLVLTALLAEETATVAAAYQALPMLFWPILTMAIGCLLSGVVLGLGSRWGVLRYRWVAVKLAINLVLVTLVALLLGPGLDEAAEAGRVLAAGGSPDIETGSLVYGPVVSTVSLLVATWLSVAKPWGRVRRSS